MRLTANEWGVLDAPHPPKRLHIARLAQRAARRGVFLRAPIADEHRLERCQRCVAGLARGR